MADLFLFGPKIPYNTHIISSPALHNFLPILGFTKFPPYLWGPSSYWRYNVTRLSKALAVQLGSLPTSKPYRPEERNWVL